MTLIDLRMNYKKLTGDNFVPLNHGYFGDVNYILWLEELLLKHINLKKKLLPWEKLDENPKLIHE
jgi:hypothetical protein